MTTHTHPVHHALAALADRDRLARAAADETGAITAEYGDRVSSGPPGRLVA